RDRARGAVDATTGVRGRRAEVEAADPGFRPGEARDRPEEELLAQLRGAAVDRSADEVRVGGFELARAGEAARGDPVAKAGREALDLGLDALGEVLEIGRSAFLHVHLSIFTVSAFPRISLVVRGVHAQDHERSLADTPAI